jgi:hypothetical protein
MIWVTAYPGGLSSDDSSRSPLSELAYFCRIFLPNAVGVHLLPFHPSDGDDGFAPRDWKSVDSALGDWSDIALLADARKLVADGVINHSIAQRFFRAPDSYADLVYAFRGEAPPFDLRSPRGDPVIQSYTIRGEPWFLWQTFSRSQVDIRLDSHMIQREITAYLRRLQVHGVWGVRLDAAAYYAKPNIRGEVQLHHPGARRLARMMVNIVRQQGLSAIAQLDCDRYGAPYFPGSEYGVPIVDYSFAAHLAHAMMTGDSRDLARHISETDGLESILIRAPRTHDGILLRSDLLNSRVRSELIEKAGDFGIPARIIEGSPYELNCSLPHLFSCGVAKDQGWHRIEIAVAVSCFISGWGSLYLPILLDHIPENCLESMERLSLNDPRSLNRCSVPVSTWRRYLRSRRADSMRRLLTFLVDLVGVERLYDFASVSAPEVFAGRVLLVDRPQDRVRLAVNFDPISSYNLEPLVQGVLQIGARTSGYELGPLGVSFWRY